MAGEPDLTTRGPAPRAGDGQEPGRLLGAAERGTFSCLRPAIPDGVGSWVPHHAPKESILVRRMSRSLAIALLGVVSAGCAAFLANTDVSMVSLAPVTLQGEGQRVQASFRVVNHNATQSQLVGVLYRLDLREPAGGWAEWAEGYSVQAVPLPPGQPTEVTFTLDGLRGDEVPPQVFSDGAYRLVGELRVLGGLGEVQVPFSFPSEESGESGSPPSGQGVEPE